jgi:hypothetical protein
MACEKSEKKTATFIVDKGLPYAPNAILKLAADNHISKNLPDSAIQGVP